MKKRLVQGQCYVATVILTGIKATFGNEDDVREAFEDVGLKAEVTPLGDNPDGGEVYRVKGIWAKPTETVELPDEVVLVQECLTTGKPKGSDVTPKPAEKLPVRDSRLLEEAPPSSGDETPGIGAAVALLGLGGAVALYFATRRKS